MDISTQYAKALFELIEANKKPTAKTVADMLARRGHTKLLPRIVAELSKLQLQKERSQKNKIISPKARQTQILVELYKKLTHV